MIEQAVASRLLLVIGHAPYDGTDVVWNALRLADTALDENMEVRLFLMNEGVDLARKEPPQIEAEFDLSGMLRDLAARGAAVKLCQTCLRRCGIGTGSVLPETEPAGMKDLLQWIRSSDRVLTF